MVRTLGEETRDQIFALNKETDIEYIEETTVGVH